MREAASRRRRTRAERDHLASRGASLPVPIGAPRAAAAAESRTGQITPRGGSIQRRAGFRLLLCPFAHATAVGALKSVRLWNSRLTFRVG